MYSNLPHIPMKILKCITLAVTIITIFSLSSNVCGDEKDFPFHPGEKLTFRLRWTIIPAGESVLEVLPMETIDGINAYHFVLTAKSNAFIDQFYKVRDRIDSYVSAD
ncbi:MAG: DUF3108 domain-containing protein, partial [Desulfobacterales bacterium]